MNESALPSFRAMAHSDVEAVLAIEQRAYPWPWSRGNFTDSLQSLYRCQVLLLGDQLLGYVVVLPGVDEAHVLNVTVCPNRQGQGFGRLLLQDTTDWARQRRSEWLWLEVRESNQRAIDLYGRLGWVQVGERKNYYPGSAGQREHARVMNLHVPLDNLSAPCSNQANEGQP